ncbi:MAG: hypothetical protein ACYCPT_02125 [Acidimicrobiales bacterium]
MTFLVLLIAALFVAVLVASVRARKLFGQIIGVDLSLKRIKQGMMTPFGIRVGEIMPMLNDARGVLGPQLGLKCVGFATVTNGTAGAFASTGEGLTMARTGAGTYTATLDTELGGGTFGAVTDPCFFVMSLSAAEPIVDAAITSTSVLTIHTNSAVGVPADAATGFMVVVFSPAISGQ